MDKNLNSEWPSQHVKYFKLKKDSQFLDINGNPVHKTLPGGLDNPDYQTLIHLPLSEVTDELLDIFLIKAIMKRNLEGINSNLTYIHFHLCSLSYYNRNMFAAEESLIEDHFYLELLNHEWGQDILRNVTFILLQNFRTSWMLYKKDKHYSESSILVSIDPEWKNIVKQDLIPAILELEKDLDKYEIEYGPILKNYKPDVFPPVEDILQMGSHLNKLLLDHKIISKNYIE